MKSISIDKIKVNPLFWLIFAAFSAFALVACSNGQSEEAQVTLPEGPAFIMFYTDN